MKTTLINTLSIALVILATSCNSSKKNENQTPAEPEVQIEYSEDNSRNSVDWQGTYEGELPCADCEGIKTFITINNDQTYLIKETYLGKNEMPFETKGTFEWDDSGQKIILSDTNRHSYFVGENTLTHLDRDGNKIIGDMESLYVLSKIGDPLLANKWELVALNEEAITPTENNAERPFLQFHEDNTFNGYTGCNRIQGGFESTPQLKLLQGISTLRACPETDIESKFLAAINALDTYAFESNNLVFLDKDQQKLATFRLAN